MRSFPTSSAVIAALDFLNLCERDLAEWESHRTPPLAYDDYSGFDDFSNNGNRVIAKAVLRFIFAFNVKGWAYGCAFVHHFGVTLTNDSPAKSVPVCILPPSILPASMSWPTRFSSFGSGWPT